jgi:hypothetical protein
MKKSTILWSVSLTAVCFLGVLHVFQLMAIPVSFKPNWLTITPVLVIWGAGAGVLIHKYTHKYTEVPEPRTQEAENEAELVVAGEPTA